MCHTTYVVDKKWEFQIIDVITVFLYAVLEEEIYMKIPEGTTEVLVKNFRYKNILALIKSIYGLVQVARWWFREYIKRMDLKEGFKQCKTKTYLLYRLNELCTVIGIVYLDKPLEIGNKPELMNTV